jgi:uncharacterized RDD family membrane protein YckC
MHDESKPRTQTEHDLPYAPSRAIFGAAPMVLVETPVDQADASAKLATRSARFFARIIDWMLVLASFVPMFLYEWFGRGSPALAYVFFTLGGFFVMSAIQWYLIATRGQSIGKRLLQIKVVHLDGSPVGFLHGVVLREWAPALVSAVPFIGRLIWIVDPILIFRPDHQCLHDKIAGTKVVELELTQRGFSPETP